ncbi:MAG: alpha/beta hydrolase [Flavobacterium sp.]|nr:alpha/beta hydrolase [Flavobacterium sp.]
MYRHIIMLLLCLPMSAIGQSTATAQISSFDISDPIRESSKKIWVYLPMGYENSNKKYPVLYMHDAQNLFDNSTAYAGEWNVDETLDSLKLDVIVIGIEHGNEKRIDELTPFPNEKYGGGQADPYLDFIVQTLKPHVDKNYRTKQNRKNTMIMGSSLGGLVSYYALLRHPTIFGKAGVFSPSLWFSDEIFQLTERTKKINANIYLLAGDSESENLVAELNRLHAMLIGKSATVHCTIIKDGKHNEKLWRESFAHAVQWLMSAKN